ncbi:MAG: hypothetical protein GY811_23410 [Myxococcales bacterium]|nr:hypothetical protein [Myxococcales bacterium]
MMRKVGDSKWIKVKEPKRAAARPPDDQRKEIDTLMGKYNAAAEELARNQREIRELGEELEAAKAEIRSLRQIEELAAIVNASLSANAEELAAIRKRAEFISGGQR